ncbi:DUF4870 domain-containing protein [Candidatus Beckwithbacteria bacterium]|nr:DUF4870 domain-containing protein [Candidatus Beckwithbacteria bacterium]
MAEDKKSKNNTATGLDQNIENVLCYVGGWLTGLIFLLLAKENKRTKFHAMQSLVIFGGISVLSFIPVIGWFLSWILWIVAFVLWLVLIIKAYQGEDWEVPVVGEFVKKQIK